MTLDTPLTNVLGAALMASLAFAQNATGALETRAAAKLRSREAAKWSGLFDLLLWIEFALVVKVELWLAIPSIVGGVAGTYWSVERKKKRLAKARKEKHDRLREMAPEQESGTGRDQNQDPGD